MTIGAPPVCDRLRQFGSLRNVSVGKGLLTFAGTLAQMGLKR